MAFSSVVMQSFCFIFPSNPYPRPPPISISPISFSQASNFLDSSFSPAKSNHHHVKSKHLYRVNTEGVSSELVEDPKFVPLNADDPRYGPPLSRAGALHIHLMAEALQLVLDYLVEALLLLGFEAEETVKIQHLLQELDGEFLKVIHCTEDMIDRPLWEAMHAQQPDLEVVKSAKSLPRICFLSGLTGEEMMMFIDAFPETGLKPAVFAALVPNSANKLLGEVMEEIMGDYEMMSAKQPSPP